MRWILFALLALASAPGCRKRDDALVAPVSEKPALAGATPARLRGTYATDAGMTCLWDPDAFADVKDYDTWEARLLEDKDIVRQIEAGAFVPINIGADGVHEIEVRVGTTEHPAALSDREAKYALVASEPYLFRSRGRLAVSGIERVAGKPGEDVGVLPVAEGDYAVTLHLVAWDREPGMTDDAGKPKKEALPDFVALVNPRSKAVMSFRVSPQTFPKKR